MEYKKPVYKFSYNGNRYWAIYYQCTKDLFACAHVVSSPVHVAFLISHRDEEHGPYLPLFSIKKATSLDEKVEAHVEYLE